MNLRKLTKERKKESGVKTRTKAEGKDETIEEGDNKRNKTEMQKESGEEK
jgi:hypothetical protein